MYLQAIYIYIYEEDLVLNNLQCLICHKTLSKQVCVFYKEKKSVCVTACLCESESVYMFVCVCMRVCVR